MDSVPGLSKLIDQGSTLLPLSRPQQGTEKQKLTRQGDPRDLVVDVHKETTLIDAVRPVSYGVGRRFDLRIGCVLLSAAIPLKKANRDRHDSTIHYARISQHPDAWTQGLT